MFNLRRVNFLLCSHHYRIRAHGDRRPLEREAGCIASNRGILLQIKAGILLGISGVPIPWKTIALSVVIYICTPLVFGYIKRSQVIKRKGVEMMLFLVWLCKKTRRFFPSSSTRLGFQKTVASENKKC
jgi:hypothetical protein